MKIVRIGKLYVIMDGFVEIAHFEEFEKARMFLGEQENIYEYFRYNENMEDRYELHLEDSDKVKLH